MRDDYLAYTPEVEAALGSGQPVLALESTIISHGLPYPENREFARTAEETVRAGGATPATIAVADGKLRVGVSASLLDQLATDPATEKVTRRDLAPALARDGLGATTVSATMHIARLAGIEVFATGGIGGVHRGADKTFDISQDLHALSDTPLVVVSAGAKAILDLPRTLEYLETAGVSVVGYQTTEFPAFYSRCSGLKVPLQVESAAEVARLYRIQQEIDSAAALLVANPIPAADELPEAEINPLIEQALRESRRHKITGKALTPFLLRRLMELTNGRTLAANISLALNNIRLGTAIAVELSKNNQGAR